MAKYINSKEVIELMKQGWKLERKTNYNDTKTLSYWLGKRGETTEHSLTKKTRELLFENGAIDGNNDLVRI